MKLFGRRTTRERRAPDYWNGSVVERIERDAGVDRDTAARYFAEMLIFLDMAAESKHFISPPKAVDLAWHAFILHTRDYESYCRERYGRVIHHQPTETPDPDAYRRAYERRAEAGPVDAGVWIAPVAGGGFFGGFFGGDGSDSGGGSSGDFGGGSSCGGGGGG